MEEGKIIKWLIRLIHKERKEFEADVGTQKEIFKEIRDKLQDQKE